MTHYQKELLWHTLRAWLFDAPMFSMERFSAEMFEFEWPKDIECHIIEYMSSTKDNALYQLALSTLKGLYLSDYQHTVIVGGLLKNQLISIKCAVSFMTPIRCNKDQSAWLQHLIDVVWLLNQDEKDAVMNIDQDNLFLSAMHNFLDNELTR